MSREICYKAVIVLPEQVRLCALPNAYSQHQQRHRCVKCGIYLDDPVYAFNGGGNSRLVPDQTSNACTRRDGEDELLV